MPVLAVINWTTLFRQADMQDIGVAKSQAASQVQHDSNLGAQAYRVAGTFINRQLDEVQ